MELISHVKMQATECVKTFASDMCAGYECLELTKNFKKITIKETNNWI